MFEKFGVDIRTAVVLGVEEAKALNATQVRPEHLLIGLVLQGEGPAAGMLAAHGLDEATARRLAHDRAGTDLDGEALAAIGIDVERVRASVEQTFGRGALDRIRFRPRRFHLPFDSAAKAALRDSLVHAKQERRNRLDGTHLLRALLDADDPGVLDLLQRAEIDPEELRREARRRPRGAA